MQEIYKKPLSKKLFHVFIMGMIGVSLFMSGWAFGTGRISIFSRLQTQNPALPEDLDYSSIEHVYDQLRVNYDGKLDVDTLLDGLKTGLAQSTGDSYTEYLNREDAKSFDDELNGTFEGIGAELSKEDNLIVIVAPIKGFPAAKAGLKPRDIITAINDEPATNLTVTEAVSKIRGPAGTNVKLTVVRDRKQELEFDITRESIKLPSLNYEMLSGNIGYIELSRFSDDTATLAEKAAKDLKNQGAKGIILDMRGNPGGLLDAAVDVSSLWLDKGETVLEEKRGGVTIKTYRSSGGNTFKSMPTVVLINEGSASASEIVAGALSDHNAATLIGQKSFGKGSVQGLEQIASGGILKVTIARWYTPNGHNIDKQGIEPKIKVEISKKQLEQGKDPQKQSAINFLLK